MTPTVKDIIKKFQLIYFRFLWVAIGYIILYTFLNWLLIIKFEVISLKEDLVGYWLPVGLVWIPIYLLLRPRIRLLKLKDKRNNLPFIYQFVLGISIIIPTLIAQNYILTSTGKLTHLESVNDIDKSEKTKYYTISKYFIDKTHPGVYGVAKVSGKYNEDLDLSIYLATPVFEKNDDTLAFKMEGNIFRIQGTSGVHVWIGTEYHRRISNRLSDEKKEKEKDLFEIYSMQDYHQKDLSHFQYLDRIGNSDDHDYYNQACIRSFNRPPAEPIVFVPVQEPYEVRNGSAFEWIIGSFCIGACVGLIMILIPKFDQTAVRNFISGKPAKKEEKNEYLSFFTPREGFIVTPLLIDLNILIFVIMVFSGLGFLDFKAIDLLKWGANYRPYVTDGNEWWRLLTNTFLHCGIMHLFMNIYGLLFVGLFLEPILGNHKFIISYLITGVIASIASIYWHEHTVSVGASGAIFGMYGILLSSILLKKHSIKSNNGFLFSIIIFIGYNLFIGLLIDGIDNAAHIGGFLSGFAIGHLIFPTAEGVIENGPIE